MAPTDGYDAVAAPPVADTTFEACIRLASGTKDEERFLGATLALQYAGSIAADIGKRARLLEALTPAFVARLLKGSLPSYRRIGLALFRALALEGPGAQMLAVQCASLLGLAWAQAMEAAPPGQEPAEGEIAGDAGNARVDSFDEVPELIEALRQAVCLLKDRVQEIGQGLGLALEQPLRALAEQVRSAKSVDSAPALQAALALIQELSALSFSSAAADSLLEAVCLASPLRGSHVRGLALGVLSERVEVGLACSDQLGEVLGEQLLDARAAGLGGGIPAPDGDAESRWQVCASTLRLAAVGLQRQGLDLLGGPVPQSLKRLKALLKLAAGEVHLGLEGEAPLEALCAGCMFAEAATIALISESDKLEENGALQDSADCLQSLHRIVRHAYDFCLDLPDGDEVPSPLPIVARLIGLWQVEDPMRFASEFQRALPIFCRLPPAEFEVLLPSIQELQDWQLTPALGKVLHLLAYALGHGAHSGEDNGSEDLRALLQPCALGLTEVALDAAVYMPDAPLPKAPIAVPRGDYVGGDMLGALAAHIQNSDIPRPVVAADPAHPGVQRLCAWSACLWVYGRSASHLNSLDHSLLALTCAALLTSVPDAALLNQAPGQDMWRAVADFVLISCSTEAQAAAGLRLALRFCGFALDRHPALAYALVCSSAARHKAGQQWLPRALPRADNDEADEWRLADDAAATRVRSFLKVAVPLFKDMPPSTRTEVAGELSCVVALDSAPTEGLDDMD